MTKKLGRGQIIAILANLGVICGLVLVALELNQATKAILGATYQANAESSSDWNKWTIDSDYLIPVVVKYLESGRDALTLEEQIRYGAALEAAFDRHDAFFYQYELGLLDDEFYETTFRRNMRQWVPRWREWGFLEQSTIRETIRPSFAREIEKYLDEPFSVGAGERAVE